jgi:carotenoid cleavage dioxygenase
MSYAEKAGALVFRRGAEQSMFLSGNFAPVAQEITVDDLKVTGRLPRELDGWFMLIGPNPVKPPSKRYFWFSGDGMIHAIRLRDGLAVEYRNRWVRSRRVSRALGENRVPTARRLTRDTANTKVFRFGGLTLALADAGCLPARLDDELRTLAFTDLGGALPTGISAHPKIDPATGEMHALSYYPGRHYVQHAVLDRHGALRSTQAIEFPSTPMMHDFSLTPNHVVLFDLPVRVSLPQAAVGRSPLVWRGDYPARFGLLPRRGAPRSPTWFPVSACAIYHSVNSYETSGGQVVVEAVRYDRSFDKNRSTPAETPPALWRWTLDPATGNVCEDQISDLQIDYPIVNATVVGQAHRFSYFVGGEASAMMVNSLVKHDSTTDRMEVRSLPSGHAPSDCEFVPNPYPTSEDDGWILSYVYNPAINSSYLLVLAAQDFTGKPLAIVELPTRIPFGFHTTWLPKAS